ncbi:MAG: HAMP domain-containing protein, partial [Planctomycetota bacterium]|nr:HAMP domain-containing protein [Planctomycetota bacterium]
VYAEAWLGIEYATLVVLLTGVVLGFLFLLFFDLSVLRRLSRTREAVAAIESGALDPSAFSLSGRDELSRLADTVANMARSLQEYQAGLRQARDLLEQKVKQRRAELVEAHGRLQQEMEERQRLEAAVQRAERLRELAAVAASVGQAVDEPLSNLRAGLTSLENLLRAATEPKREEVLILFQSLTAHRRRLAAVLDQVRCLIRGREMHPQWRTNLAPCLAEAIAIFAVSCPSAPCPLIDCEDRLPVLAVPAVPLQHMLVYLLETLATAADTAAAVCISARREGERVRVRLSHPQARPAVIAQKPWRLVLAQALAFSWNADYQVEEIGDTVAIALGLPVAASPSQPL